MIRIERAYEKYTTSVYDAILYEGNNILEIMSTVRAQSPEILLKFRVLNAEGVWATAGCYQHLRWELFGNTQALLSALFACEAVVSIVHEFAGGEIEEVLPYPVGESIEYVLEFKS